MSGTDRTEAEAQQEGVEVPRRARNVVYLGHLPQGFCEQPLQGFLSQFGTVLRLRVARSPVTGACRGYAFVQFEDARTARVVARHMHKQPILGKLVVAKVVPPERVHPRLWKGMRRVRKLQMMEQRRWIHGVPRLSRRKRVPAALSEGRLKRLARGERERNKRLKEMGINYSFSGCSAPVKDDDAT